MDALLLLILLLVGLVVSHGFGPLARPYGHRRKFLEPESLVPRPRARPGGAGARSIPERCGSGG